MDLSANMLALADRYCAEKKISRSRLATIVVNDGKFFDRIDKGGSLTVRTYERFIEFFKAAGFVDANTQDEPAVARIGADEVA